MTPLHDYKPKVKDFAADAATYATLKKNPPRLGLGGVEIFDLAKGEYVQGGGLHESGASPPTPPLRGWPTASDVTHQDPSRGPRVHLDLLRPVARLLLGQTPTPADEHGTLAVMALYGQALGAHKTLLDRYRPQELIDSPPDPRAEKDPRGWMWIKGRRVWPMELLPTDIDIDTVAHALGNLCRFGGHTKFFYSVAQHSVLVSHLVEQAALKDVAIPTTDVRVLALAGLLHDASEAYLIDLPRPIKNHPEMFPYRAAEHTAMGAVAGFMTQYGLTTDHFTHPLVLAADEDQLEGERLQLFETMSSAWSPCSLNPSPYLIEPMDGGRAKQVFLRRFHELTAAGE